MHGRISELSFATRKLWDSTFLWLGYYAAHTMLEMNYTKQQHTTVVMSEGLRPALAGSEWGAPNDVLCWFVSYPLVGLDEKGFCWLLIWKPHPIRYTKHMECNGSTYDFGKAWVVGVSNFSTKKLGDLSEISCIPHVVNQVDRHPSWEQRNCMLSQRM